MSDDNQSEHHEAKYHDDRSDDQHMTRENHSVRHVDANADTGAPDRGDRNAQKHSTNATKGDNSKGASALSTSSDQLSSSSSENKENRSESENKSDKDNSNDKK